jgi:hypothetical protein
LSEVLQARIYQPVGVNAARPDAVNETASFNEYTSLFERPRARAFGGITYGRTNEDLSELFGGSSSGLEFVNAEDPEIRAGEAVGTLNGERFAAAIGYRKTSDDGFRFNADRSIANYRVFFEAAPSFRDTVQVNLLYGRQESGDLPPRALVGRFTPERFESRLTNVGVGYVHRFGPGSALALSAIYNKTRQTAQGLEPFETGGGTGVLEGPQLELQFVRRTDRTSWVTGAGVFEGETRLEGTVGPAGEGLESDDSFLGGYVYGRIRALGPVEITVGAALERAEAPTGLLVPRDSQIGAAEITYEKSQLSPKFGISYYAPTGTTLRAAAFSRLSPAIGRIQTLEPTQVAGFNQFFGDPGGTESIAWGFGADQEFGRHLFAGLSVLRREREIPEASCSDPNRFAGCAGSVASQVEVRESHDLLGSAYVNAAIGRHLAAGIEYGYEERKFDFTKVNNDGFFEDRIETGHLRPQVRWFFPWGLFAVLAANRTTQEVDQIQDLASSERDLAKARFWTADAQIGYRLPRRYGAVILEGRNVTDREFEYYDREPEETLAPARTITLTASFAF